MWLMYLQSLKFLCPTIKGEVHLQESTLYILWPYEMLPSTPYIMTHAPAKFEVATSYG